MSEQTSHKCAAKGCTKDVPEGVLMCRMHWVMISSATQVRIYQFFRADPHGGDYVQAVRDAITEVKEKEDTRRQHAAEERHEFREALKLLRRIPYLEPCDAELTADIQAFLKRHPDG